MYLYHSVTFFHCLFNLWGTPSSTEHPFFRGVAATVAPQQHGIGLFLLDTGRTKGKGQLVATSHWKYRVKQIGGGENIHEGNAKIVGNVLISRLGQNGRMSDGVTGILVDPRVKGGHVYIAYFFSFRGHRVKSHGPGSSSKKGMSRLQGFHQRKIGHKSFDGGIVFAQDVPVAFPHHFEGVTAQTESSFLGQSGAS